MGNPIFNKDMDSYMHKRKNGYVKKKSASKSPSIIQEVRMMWQRVVSFFHADNDVDLQSIGTRVVVVNRSRTPFAKLCDRFKESRKKEEPEKVDEFIDPDVVQKTIKENSL